MVIKTNTINTSNVLAGFVAYLQEEDVIYAFLVQIFGGHSWICGIQFTVCKVNISSGTHLFGTLGYFCSVNKPLIQR